MTPILLNEVEFPISFIFEFQRMLDGKFLLFLGREGVALLSIVDPALPFLSISTEESPVVAYLVLLVATLILQETFELTRKSYPITSHFKFP